MHHDNSGEAAADSGIDGLPLRLAFDMGERSITLGELRQLQVGQTLDLGRPLTHTVSLRVNGALVGTGELVDIDGRLGVVIGAIAGAELHPAGSQSEPESESLDEATTEAGKQPEEAWEQE